MKKLPLENHILEQFTSNVHRKVSQTDKFYYAPLYSTLEKLMELDDYQAEVFSPHSSKYYLADFCDGTLYKSHPDPHALQIIAYYDYLEIVNPLGSYTKKT